MLSYLIALVLAVVGGICIAAAIAIRCSKSLTGEEHERYGDLEVFIVGLALECIALVVFVVNYLVRNAL